MTEGGLGKLYPVCAGKNNQKKKGGGEKSKSYGNEGSYDPRGIADLLLRVNRDADHRTAKGEHPKPTRIIGQEKSVRFSEGSGEGGR